MCFGDKGRYNEVRLIARTAGLKPGVSMTEALDMSVWLVSRASVFSVSSVIALVHWANPKDIQT